MKPIPFEVGRVVLSTQGRDKGRLFAVVSVVDDTFVFMADGDLRKMERPKRKRVKHLRAKPYLIPELAAMLSADKGAADSRLRKVLAQAAQEPPINKEGRGFVQK